MDKIEKVTITTEAGPNGNTPIFTATSVKEGQEGEILAKGEFGDVVTVLGTLWGDNRRGVWETVLDPLTSKTLITIVAFADQIGGF